MDFVEPRVLPQASVDVQESDDLAAQRLGLGVMSGGVQHDGLRGRQQRAMHGVRPLEPRPVAAGERVVVVHRLGLFEHGFSGIDVSDRRILDRQECVVRNQRAVDGAYDRPPSHPGAFPELFDGAQRVPRLPLGHGEIETDRVER